MVRSLNLWAHLHTSLSKPVLAKNPAESVKQESPASVWLPPISDQVPHPGPPTRWCLLTVAGLQLDSYWVRLARSSFSLLMMTSVPTWQCLLCQCGLRVGRADKLAIVFRSRGKDFILYVFIVEDYEKFYFLFKLFRFQNIKVKKNFEKKWGYENHSKIKGFSGFLKKFTSIEMQRMWIKLMMMILTRRP